MEVVLAVVVEIVAVDARNREGENKDEGSEDDGGDEVGPGGGVGGDTVAHCGGFLFRVCSRRADQSCWFVGMEIWI